MTSRDVQQKLRSLASAEVAVTSAKFFKTGPGDYGHGDTFIGIRIPTLRQVAREFRDLPLNEIGNLLQSAIHEERMLALLILVKSVERGDATRRKAVFDCYLENLQYVNNWDLVDSSAPAIVGGWLQDKSRQILRKWARSENLWERRIAIIATQYFIRLNDFEETLAISRLLLNDQEDLIHKAVGWMLREVGKRDVATLDSFLKQHQAVMPRTMLRYAIEKFPAEKRLAVLRARHGSE